MKILFIYFCLNKHPEGGVGALTGRAWVLFKDTKKIGQKRSVAKIRLPGVARNEITAFIKHTV
jgi:hypothetical protein